MKRFSGSLAITIVALSLTTASPVQAGTGFSNTQVSLSGAVTTWVSTYFGWLLGGSSGQTSTLAAAGVPID